MHHEPNTLLWQKPISGHSRGNSISDAELAATNMSVKGDTHLALRPSLYNALIFPFPPSAMLRVEGPLTMPRHRHSPKRIALKFYEYVKGCSGSQLIRVNMEAGNRAFVLNVILSRCSQGTTRLAQSFRALRTAFSG